MTTNRDWEFPFSICHPTYKSFSDSSYIKRKTNYTYLLINEVAWSSNFVNIIFVKIRRERQIFIATANKDVLYSLTPCWYMFWRVCLIKSTMCRFDYLFFIKTHNIFQFPMRRNDRFCLRHIHRWCHHLLMIVSNSIINFITKQEWFVLLRLMKDFSCFLPHWQFHDI